MLLILLLLCLIPYCAHSFLIAAPSRFIANIPRHVLRRDTFPDGHHRRLMSSHISNLRLNAHKRVAAQSDEVSGLVTVSDSDVARCQSNPHFQVKPMPLPNMEKCIIVAVEATTHSHKPEEGHAGSMTLTESLQELKELIKTAGIHAEGCCVQKLTEPVKASYIGAGKAKEVAAIAKSMDIPTIVVDDDLTPRQQRALEDLFSEANPSYPYKILDRTAVILEIFAQRARSKEGILQVELAMLEYRMNRGPRASGTDRDNGAGFRGPGESKVETDKRVIKERILLVKKELSNLLNSRLRHRQSREDNLSSFPLVTLCGYTNAGKSTLMNALSSANVLAEDKLFATLDPTTRRARIHSNTAGKRDVLLSDTVGFISKLPASLVAAFRSTLSEVLAADVLVHVIDRSNPSWQKQRVTVMRELHAVGCHDTPIIELWNKVDLCDDPSRVREEAQTVPRDAEMNPSSPSNSPSVPAPAPAEFMDAAAIMDDVNDYSDSSGDKNDVMLRKRVYSNATVDSGFDLYRENIKVVVGSAKTGEGMEDFQDTLLALVNANLQSVTLEIPHADSDMVIAQLHSVGTVLSVQFNDNGAVVAAKIPKQHMSAVSKYLLV